MWTAYPCTYLPIIVSNKETLKKILCMSWGTSNSISLIFCLFYNFDHETICTQKKSAPYLDGSKVDELWLFFSLKCCCA